MTDRELLEAAAKAAGYELVREADFPSDSYLLRGYEDAWNPLLDDGDALRLAVKLGLFSPSSVGSFRVFDDSGDPCAATRRAIVRAAAAAANDKP